MAATEFSSHSAIPSADTSLLNSYGALPLSNDIEVGPSTISSPVHKSDSDSTRSIHHKSPKTPCLKPHQSETIFALCLFTIGLSLLCYVIILYWFTHSQISPVIFVCGLLCFIPGCYYLVHNCCCLYSSKRNHHRHSQVSSHDDSI